MTEYILSYNGKLTFDIINNLLVDYKQVARTNEIDIVVAKRIYAILVEGLENAFRHKTETSQSTTEVKLSIQQKIDTIEIKIGNYINEDNINKVTDKLALINSLDLVGLNRLYRASITKARISDKGGAGLGLIEIARNSRYNINYNIIKEQGDQFFIVLTITISNNPNKVKTI